MVEVVVDQKPMKLPPVDPNVIIPESVKRRAAQVDALYAKQAPPAQNGSQAAQPPAREPEPEQLPLPMEAPLAVRGPGEVPASTQAPAPDDENNQTWKRQALTWQGRYNSSVKTIGEMQEQMNQLGSELLRTRAGPRTSVPQSVRPALAQTYLTEKDVAEYGTDLVDFTQRAAVQAVTPHLQAISQQNEYLQERLAKESRRGLDLRVEQAVPNYREIDREPRWHNWLLGIDILSGRVRQTLLNEAIAAAEAPRVISFFKGFLNEEQATGHLAPALAPPQPAAPREAAVPLATLAAPGRARPAAGGDTAFPPERPIYTRAQIRQLYEQHRRGAYAGREAEWARQDADIIAAGREGRVQ